MRCVCLVILLAAGAGGGAPERKHGKGRLYELDGYRVLELAGTPKEMGEAHGRLLSDVIRRVLKGVLRAEEEKERYEDIMRGTKVMERFQPEEYRREMKALAGAAGVEYMDVVALQLFGDAERGMRGTGELDEKLLQKCSNYAVFGPATRTGECIVGRNFDYWYQDVSEYASIIIHYRPEKGRSFVSLSWAGVVNGWTLMNDKGLVAANNTAFSTNESLEGMSTCFLMRRVIERASTVKEAEALVREGPRAVGTIMLVAGGDPPDAAEIEFDHKDVAVRKARKGYVVATNGFVALGRREPVEPGPGSFGRYGTLLGLILKNHGKIDRSMNFAAARGVPLTTINLHCALVFPRDRTFYVSMGKAPACDGRFRRFRMTDKGIELVKPR